MAKVNCHNLRRLQLEIAEKAFSPVFCINFLDKTPRCAEDTLGQCHEVLYVLKSAQTA